MLESENLELIKKGKFLHKECCHYNTLKNGICAYFQTKVDPNKVACTQFNTCNKCSKRANKEWDRLVKNAKNK